MTTIDEIKARCAAATAGPWAPDTTILCAKVVKYNPYKRLVHTGIDSASIDNTDIDAYRDLSLANAEFIAAARSDIPLLVRALELACESLAHFRDPSKNADYWLELAVKALANV